MPSSAVAAAGISGGLGLLGSAMAGSSAGGSASDQNALMAAINKWGYGYPDWLRQGLQDYYNVASGIQIPQAIDPGALIRELAPPTMYEGQYGVTQPTLTAPTRPEPIPQAIMSANRYQLPDPSKIIYQDPSRLVGVEKGYFLGGQEAAANIPKDFRQMTGTELQEFLATNPEVIGGTGYKGLIPGKLSDLSNLNFYTKVPIQLAQQTATNQAEIDAAQAAWDQYYKDLEAYEGQLATRDQQLAARQGEVQRVGGELDQALVNAWRNLPAQTPEGKPMSPPVPTTPSVPAPVPQQPIAQALLGKQPAAPPVVTPPAGPVVGGTQDIPQSAKIINDLIGQAPAPTPIPTDPNQIAQVLAGQAPATGQQPVPPEYQIPVQAPSQWPVETAKWMRQNIERVAGQYPMDEITAALRGARETVMVPEEELWSRYRDMAKSGFATSERALEEMGLKGGVLDRARMSMAEALGGQLTQSRVQASTDAALRASEGARLAAALGQPYAEQAGMYGRVMSALPLETQLTQLPYELQRQYWQDQMITQGAGINYLNQALQTITGIPSYSYTPTQVPGVMSYMGPALAGAASDVAGAWAYNQGMQQPNFSTLYANQPGWQYSGPYQYGR